MSTFYNYLENKCVIITGLLKRFFISWKQHGFDKFVEAGVWSTIEYTTSTTWTRFNTSNVGQTETKSVGNHKLEDQCVTITVVISIPIEVDTRVIPPRAIIRIISAVCGKWSFYFVVVVVVVGHSFLSRSFKRICACRCWLGLNGYNLTCESENKLFASESLEIFWCFKPLSTRLQLHHDFCYWINMMTSNIIRSG